MRAAMVLGQRRQRAEHMLWHIRKGTSRSRIREPCALGLALVHELPRPAKLSSSAPRSARSAYRAGRGPVLSLIASA
jgi:hypothetical protein